MFSFVMEFFLRWSLFTTLESIKRKDHDRLADMEADMDSEDAEEMEDEGASDETLLKIHLLQKRMKFCGLLPPFPAGGFGSMCRSLPKFLSSASNAFDAFICVICAIDNTLVEILRRLDTMQMQLSVFSAIRVFRLLRLARLLRTFHMMPQLQMLVQALVQAGKSILTVSVLLIMGLYSFSIFMVALVSRSEADSEPARVLQRAFTNIPQAMLTGFQLLSFDNWGSIVQPAFDAEYFLCGILLFVLMFLLGFGLMKMAIGIMCGSAITLNKKALQDVSRKELVEFFNAMNELKELCDTILGTRVLPQEIFENGLGLKYQPRKIDAEDADVLKSLGVTWEIVERSITVGSSTTFAAGLFRSLERAGISPALTKQIVEKVDVSGTGYITIDQFAWGALVMKEDLAKLDVFSSRLSLERLRKNMVEAKETIFENHIMMQDIVEDIHALIERKSVSRIVKRRDHTQSKVESIDKSTATALEAMSKSEVLQLRGIGKCHVFPGDGHIKLDNGYCTGTETTFRTQVRPGDVILWETGDGKDASTCGTTVLNIESHTRIVVTDAKAWTPDPMVYFIARSVPKRPITIDKDSTTTTRITVNGDLSPRSRQQLLEWEVTSRTNTKARLDKLGMEKSTLTTRVIELEKDLLTMNNRSMALTAFLALRQHVQRGKLALKASSHKPAEPGKKLTDEQEAEIHEAFVLFDTDGSGTIDRTEVRVAMRALDLEPDEKTINRVMKSADHDNNGTIDFKEFRTIMISNLLSKDPMVDIKRAFKMLDAENKGYISHGNLQKVARDLGEDVTEDELHSMLDPEGVHSPDLRMEEFELVMRASGLFE
eukprot:TRINITY_DN12632_c0_g1_i1.p1 TRINITY_DN12632_c0_g1~~TRINITY_DN12632_c0_g1_i1.p1  ORF type:complete len:828 (-),score=248.11 TRINITY_DN12632_c0_g1_i1:185-2668(-)